MTFNSTSHYVSWAPYSSGIQDNEIGINSTAAQAIGNVFLEKKNKNKNKKEKKQII